MRPNGRGLFFMNNFMDDIDYSFKPGGGTVVTLRKRLVDSAVSSEAARRRTIDMNIPSRIRDGVTILEPKGKITIGVGDIALRETVLSTLEGDNKDILINLAEVTTIDSSGIGELVSAYTTVTNRGGRLKLLHLPPKVQDILQITQLVTVFEVHDDEEEAVASFS